MIVLCIFVEANSKGLTKVEDFHIKRNYTFEKFYCWYNQTW